MAEMLLENPNWNKDMIDWLIDGEANGTKNEKAESFVKFFVRAHAGKTKNTSQQQFSVLSTSHSDT